jgi:hypothetical protein
MELQRQTRGELILLVKAHHLSCMTRGAWFSVLSRGKVRGKEGSHPPCSPVPFLTCYRVHAF